MSTVIPPNYATALIGLVGCVSVLSVYFLLKKFGRRAILRTNSFLISLVLTGFATSLIWNDKAPNEICKILQIVFMVLFLILQQTSLGPLVWIVMSEIMTEKGLTLGAFINWVCTILLGLFAQDIIEALGDNGTGSGYLFLIFAFCTFCGGLFC